MAYVRSVTIRLASQDFMKPFHITNFLITATLGGMAAVQEEINKRFPARDPVSNDVFDADVHATNDWFFTALEESCIELELLASLATVKKIKNALVKPNSSHTVLRPLQIELQERLTDEMGGKSVWALSVREAELYSFPRKGWEEIVERFPDALTDVECFACSRYAAVVFHSVQVVEVGLIELGKFIGVTDPLSGWTATTNRIQQIIKKGHDARTPFERQHFPFLEQMYGTIEGLKNAWRNKISHAQGKLTLLTSDFSPDVAEEILFATRAFMRRLATDTPLAEPTS